MAPGHPPRFVVRSFDDTVRERRRRRLLIGCWTLSLVATAAIAWGIGSHARARAGKPGSDAGSAQAAAEELRQQIANLQRGAQVADIAAKELKRNLAERDEEISGLRADLAFYSRVVGGTGQPEGLRVQGARTVPVRNMPNAWNLVVTLTQNARRGDLLKGSLAVAVEGIRDNKVTTLEGTALGQAPAATPMPFFFKYFQQVQGSFTLPAGFQPTRLRLIAQVDGDKPLSSTIPWADATRNDEANDVQP